VLYCKNNSDILINVTVKSYGFAKNTEQSPIFRTVKKFLQIALEQSEQMFYNECVKKNKKLWGDSIWIIKNT
jgi:hypothetical protein